MSRRDPAVVIRCVLDLASGERWEWTDHPEAPSYVLEPFGLVLHRDSDTGKRRADVDVLPWHAIDSFSTRRVRVARPRLVAA